MFMSNQVIIGAKGFKDQPWIWGRRRCQIGPLETTGLKSIAYILQVFARDWSTMWISILH